MSDLKYTVTIYAAAPGTRFYEKGNPIVDDQGNPETSVPGHMYYATSDGTNRTSWGFAPATHGSVNGPGTVSRSDEESYHNPLYARTMEISKDQYDKLNAFGSAPDQHGFDMRYRDARNNCVDFTWAGLNHAGLKRTEKSWDGKAHEVDGKLNYLPSQNHDSLKTIQDPVPGSPLNTEHRNPMPDMRLWQRLLSENESGTPTQLADAAGGPRPALHDDPFEQLFHASVSADDAGFSATTQRYLQSIDGQALLVAGRDANQQQDAQRQLEHAALQQAQPAAPQMSMRA